MGLRFVKACRDNPRLPFDGDRLSKQIPMSPANYLELIEQVKKDHSLGPFWTHKLLYDYDPSAGLLTFNKRSTFHEELATQVADDILDQVNKIRDDPAQPTVVCPFDWSIFGGVWKSVCPFGNAWLPDGCSVQGKRFYARGGPIGRPPSHICKFDLGAAGIVIEISYEQNERDLRDIASKYIYESHGAINVVLAISVPRRLGPATVYEWRSRMAEDAQGRKWTQMYENEPKVFRTSNDEPTKEGGHIYLTLHDLFPANQRDGIPALPITIDLNDLASYVTSAENHYLGLA
ncbi:uncharacterized protein E0L32_000926 [Thyridium curvatum]|uniref:Uncharacterized protein n=1 Tax=Thyridium curvatum TaxID=1093900 RepID=A0A507B5W4_9PEZI|nr:uncharacterized protein E0L32_000926 [Thyridium curvatum]TPX12749.1 hypothetical protein E0L32_000926 [Thyridium curvatum]